MFFVVWSLFIIFYVCFLDSIFINDKIFSSEFIVWQFLFNISEFNVLPYKEATSKDTQLKTQMILLLNDVESKGSEKIWIESGFFGDQRAELTILKANFPENIFCYVNQGLLSVIKGGETAIYLDLVVLGQLMTAANTNPAINLDTHVLQENEVIMYGPVYNKSTRLYGGLTRKLGYITLRGDERERFYSYGYHKEKSSLLYCSIKTPLPNIFSCTAFKKHLPYLYDQNQAKVKSFGMFLYLPSTLDRKEDCLKWKEHVHLHPIYVNLDDLKEITGEKEVNPSLLDNKDLRCEIVPGYCKIMKKIAEISNQNLVINSDAYISNGGKIDPDNEFSWVDNSYKLTKEKFQLTY